MSNGKKGRIGVIAYQMKKNLPPFSTVRMFLPYFTLLKPVRGAFTGAILLGVIHGAAGGFGFPFLAYKIFPRVFGEAPPDRWTLLVSILALPAAFLVRGISGFGNHYLMAYCGVRVLHAIKRRIFSHLQYLPISFFNRNRMGDIMSRINGDASAVQLVVTTVSNDLIKHPVTFLGALGALAYMAFRNHELLFLLMALLVIPICVLPIQRIGRKLLRRARQMQAETGNLNALLHENLAAAREVRAFNLQAHETQRFSNMLDHLAVLSLKAVKYSRLLPPVVEVISASGISFAIYYAARRQMSLAEVLPLMSALYVSYEPLKKLGEIHNMTKRGQASLDRIADILDIQAGYPEPEAPLPFPVDDPSITFEHVSFAYEKTNILHDINLSIPARKITAIVGPSGAGKSTLIQLIPRMYDITEGRLSIGGIPVRAMTRHDLREHVSVVAQDTVLFNDTFRANIRVGQLDATDAEVEQAARQAHAHTFILETTAGYDTVVGERGLRLSGGQRQRIAIARAFLRNAPILLLDEATSALDSESECLIQQALHKLMHGKTVVVIAHRFSTIRHASTLFVLDQGQVRATGSHTELYESDDLYRNLYDRQFVQ